MTAGFISCGSSIYVILLFQESDPAFRMVFVRNNTLADF
jgi:hypothetical protein